MGIASQDEFVWRSKTNRHDRNPVFRPSFRVRLGEVCCMIGFPNIVGGFDPFEKY